MLGIYCTSIGKKYSLTLKEEHKLRVVENKDLRKLSGGKGEEITGE